MNNDEYRSIMQMLNNKQYELCSHIMDQLQKNCEQMFIFIEGRAGVGKTFLGHALQNNYKVSQKTSRDY